MAKNPAYGSGYLARRKNHLRMSLIIDAVQITVISHATEDPDKIIKALSHSLLPHSKRLDADKRTVKGHFGNPITTWRSTARGKQAGGLFENLFQILPANDQTKILEELGSRIDEEGRLHLRLSKQDSFRGILRLEDEDPVKFTVSFKGPKASRPSVASFLRSKLETNASSSDSMSQ